MSLLRPASGLQSSPGAAFFIGVILLFVALSFGDILTGFKALVYRDFGIFGYPLAHYLRESVWRGEVPLWNPYSNCGLPFMAQWNTMVFYPFSLIYILLPMPWSAGLFCVAHLALAGIGMFVLARSWVGDDVAAGFAGVGYAFNGLTLMAMMWPNNIAALGWMPWVVWSAQRAWQKGAVVPAILIGSAQMLSGAPEIILFTWVICGVLWLVDLKNTPSRMKTAGRLLLVLVVIGALCAIQLGPFLELLAHSQRTAAAGSFNWAMPTWGPFNFLVPLFRMDQSASGVFFQETQQWTSSYYAGIGTLALAICGAIRVRSLRTYVLSGLALFSLALAMGASGFVYPAIASIVPLGFMRFPIKFVVPVMFLLPLLAAIGLNHLRQSPQARALLWRVAGVLIIAIAAIVVIAYVRPLPEQPPRTALISGLSRAAILAAFVFLIPARHRFAGLALLCLAWIDGITHTTRQNPAVDPSVYARDLLEASPIVPKPILGQGRAMISFDAVQGFVTNSLPDPAQNYLLMRLWLFENVNLLEAIPKADGFYSLYFPGERDLHFRAYGSDDQLRPALADFLSISQTTARTPERVFAWKHRPTALPMVMIGMAPIFVDRTTTLSGLMAPTFRAAEMVYLPEEARASVTATRDSAAKVLSTRFTTHNIQAEVQAEKRTMLTVSQAHYPVWKARIDGQPAMIWRANHAFQGIEVPAGKHLITLNYEDKTFRIGAAISGLTLAGLCLTRFLRKNRAVR